MGSKEGQSKVRQHLSYTHTHTHTHSHTHTSNSTPRRPNETRQTRIFKDRRKTDSQSARSRRRPPRSQTPSSATIELLRIDSRPLQLHPTPRLTRHLPARSTGDRSPTDSSRPCGTGIALSSGESTRIRNDPSCRRSCPLVPLRRAPSMPVARQPSAPARSCACRQVL